MNLQNEIDRLEHQLEEIKESDISPGAKEDIEHYPGLTSGDS
jgi:DNA repair ATPase RecN